MGVFGGDIGGKGRWAKFGAAGSGVESGREAQASVVLSKGLGGGPIGGDDGVAADVDVFGFGLAANFGKGRLVLLFLKDSTHSLLCLDIFLSFIKKTPLP